MKHLSLRWLAATLLGPVLMVLGILLVAGAPPQAAGASGKGFVQVAFTGTLTTSDGAPISQEYQRVLLNIKDVRLNPSGNLKISDSDPSWVTIKPARIGLSNPLGEHTTALRVVQLDLVTLQNLPFFFNGASIRAQRYRQVELVLNPTNPGSVVPLCPQSVPAGEGCVPFGVSLPQSKTNPLRGRFSNPYDVTAGKVQPLVINIKMTVGPVNTTVTIAPVIAPQSNMLSNGLPFNPALGLVTGTVCGSTDAACLSGTATTTSLSKTRVTAEFSGTNQIVARTRLKKDGRFALNLPAVAYPDVTLYDFYVSGNGFYVVRSGVQVSSQCPPSSPSQCTPTLGTLKVPSSSFSSISGVIHDACTAKTPIPAATLQLLVPDTTKVPATTKAISTCDLNQTVSPPVIPPNCVVVATAVTDDQGHYSYGNIPVSVPKDVHYDIEISAPGFNTTVQEVEKGKNGGLNCPCAGFKDKACKFNLEHGYLAGTTSLSGANDSGNELDVMVMAEDSGTDNIENLTLSRIPSGDTAGSFRMAVPDASPSPVPSPLPSSCSQSVTSIPVTNYDVFAAVQDLFGNSAQNISGHSIETESSVGAPRPTVSPSPAACPTLSIPPLSGFDCVGFGSVYGSVSGANPSTTSVRMSKDDAVGIPVQIMETAPNSIGTPSGNTYNFCAPSDTYVLTHYESGVPVAGSSTSVTLATPTITPTPCVSLCQPAPMASPL